MAVNVGLVTFVGAFTLAFLSPVKVVGAANEIGGTDTCNSSNALIRLLLAERTRQQTETDVRLATIEAALEGNRIQTGPLVAFFVRLGTDLDSFGFQQTLVFDEVITNIGAAYSGQTGIFICPETGLYMFGVTILSGFGQRLNMELIAAGVSRMSLHSHWGASSQSILLHLQKDSRVFVRHQLNLGQYLHGKYSTFNGYLVRKG